MSPPSFFGPTSSFYLYLVLAATVSFAGLMANSATMLIGSMLLAPFLAPVIALNTGASTQKMLVLLLSGVVAAVMMGYVGTKLFNFRDETKEMKDRTEWDTQSVNMKRAYYIIPIITGIAFAVAYDNVDIIPMAGVGIAVSILPPLVNAGVYIARGETEKAARTMKLGVSNLVLVALSYTLVHTFLLKRLDRLYFRKLSKMKVAFIPRFLKSLK